MPCLDENTVARYVSRLLSGDDAESVEEHLDTCPDCLALVCEAARSSDLATESTLVDPSPGQGRAPAPEAQLRRGDVVGRYRLMEMIGQGAMGAVYAAHDPNLDRKVALKVVRADRVEMRDAHARLSREARAMGKLAHPNVVRVYDTGDVDGGVFIAMELIDGVTLTEWLGDRSRPWQEALGVFLNAGRGLAAAHAAKIVHRDFKPDNVLIDRSGRVVVTDFGLAVASHGVDSVRRRQNGRGADAQSVDSSLTRTGVVLGTPRYMSPEQHSDRNLDARTDQFSFAVGLYHALLGQWPYEGDSLAELREAVLQGRIRQASPTAKGPPPAVVGVLVRAMHPSPEERYPSMDVLLAELERASVSPFRAWARIALVAAALLVVAAGAAFGFVRARHASAVISTSAGGLAPEAHPGARDLVVILGIDNRTGDPRLDGVVEAVLNEGLYASPRLDCAYYGLARTARDLTPDAGAVDERVARAMATRDRVPAFALRGALTAAPGGALTLSVDVKDVVGGAPDIHRSEGPVDSSDVVSAALRVSRALRAALGESPADVAANTLTLTASVEAVHEWALGRVAFYSADYHGALDHFGRAIAVDPGFAIARANLGLSLLNDEQDAAGARVMGEALRNADQLAPRRRMGVVGDYYAALGEYAKAIASYEQLLSAWPGDRLAENSLSAAAGDGGDWPLALQLARRTVSDHPELVSAHDNLVFIELANGAFDDAVRESDSIFRTFPHPPPRAYMLTFLGRTLSDQSDVARKTIADLAAIEPKSAAVARADLAFYEGRLDDASAALQEQLGQEPDDARATAGLYTRLAEILLRRGDTRAAGAAALKAKPGIQSILAADALLRVLIASGQSRAALEMMDSWKSAAGTSWTFATKLAEGEQRRVANDTRQALAAYLEALRLRDAWIVHERLAQAYLAAGAWQDAQREFSVCIARRGEGATWNAPGLHVIPAVYYGLARAKEGLHSPDAPAAYEAFLAFEPAAQHDPLVDDARRRLSAMKE